MWEERIIQISLPMRISKQTTPLSMKRKMTIASVVMARALKKTIAQQNMKPATSVGEVAILDMSINQLLPAAINRGGMADLDIVLKPAPFAKDPVRYFQSTRK